MTGSGVPGSSSSARRRADGESHAGQRITASTRSSEDFADRANRYGRGQTVGQARKRVERSHTRSKAFIVFLIVIGIALVLGASGVALYFSNVFAVTTVQVQGNRYVSDEQVLAAAGIPDDTTLLRLDASSISARISENPWISSVNVERVFPSTVVLSVEENDVVAVAKVDLASTVQGSAYWLVADDGTWVEQLETSRAIGLFGTNEVSSIVSTETSDSTAGSDSSASDGLESASTDAETEGAETIADESVATAASPTASTSGSTAATGVSSATTSVTAGAEDVPFADSTITYDELGALPLVEDLTVGLNASSGEKVGDAGLSNAITMLGAFSEEFASRVKTIDAPSAENTTFIMDDGVEVAFGAAVDVEEKEAIIDELISAHEGEISYVNVRIVSRPSWRGLATS